MNAVVNEAPVSAARPGYTKRANTGLDRVAMLLCWGLLAWQAILPWTAAHFITQDGSAHLYNGIVARSLLLSDHSPYEGIYELRSDFLPNWGSTALLALTASLFGMAHAEQALMTLLVIAVCFCFRYALRSLPNNRFEWSPLVNCLLASYFLYRGYYNLYLGMGLFLVVLGYMLRHAADFTMKRALTLGALLTGLFFIHIVPAALGVIGVSVVFGWMAAVMPLSRLRNRQEQLALLKGLRTSAAHLASALAPACLLLLTFATSMDAGNFPSDAALAWHSFPSYTFFISANRIGRAELIYPAVLAYIAAGLLLLRRREWLGPRGALGIMMGILFVLYLFVPNSGFGGGDVKIRFAWALYLVGGIVAITAARLRRVHAAFSIYVGLLLTGTLLTTQEVNARSSRLADVYLQALDALPAKATLVRIKYQVPSIRHEYDIPNDSPSDLFYHLDSYAAARRHALNLSDYEAPSGVFPVLFTNKMPGDFQSYLWGLESPHGESFAQLTALVEKSPIKVDYVLVIGELGGPAGDGVRETMNMLEAHGARIVSSASGRKEPFLRLYRTAGAPR